MTLLITPAPGARRLLRVCAVLSCAAGLLWAAGIPAGETPVREDTSEEPGSSAGPADELRDREQRLVERGEYIVHHVAMCIYCHSPRDQQGQVQRVRLLQGGRIPFPSPYAGQQWAFTAPRLAGLPAGWGEDELVRFLRTGETSDTRPPRPPMPPYRMTAQDAEAVVAYLKTL